jgi:2-dehydropantoate 2-reductase
MKIAIMGSGGVGGYFGARLAEAGYDVTFIARGDHLQALRTNGLQVVGRHEFTVKPVQATGDPSSIGPVDLVLLATKLWAVEEPAAALKPILKDDAGVVSLLNGVDSEDRLIAVLGREHVLGGVAYISSVIDRPGVIRMHADFGHIAFGELDNDNSTPRAQAYAEAFRAANICEGPADDIHRLIWSKFLMLSSFAGITSLTRLPIGPIREHDETFALLVDHMREVEAVARARDVALPDDIVARTEKMVRDWPPVQQSSMQQDLARGNRIEVPWLSGMVAKLGAEHGIDTPVARFVTAALAPYASGRPEV